MRERINQFIQRGYDASIQLQRFDGNEIWKMACDRSSTQKIRQKHRCECTNFIGDLNEDKRTNQ
jgi:hypothetical protein